MVAQSKTSFYTIKHGHLHGQTGNTKEYYSFNTFYMNGFRNKYGIITSTICNEFYRAIYLLSICWYNGGHLLIINTTEKYHTFLYNLFYLGISQSQLSNNQLKKSNSSSPEKIKRSFSKKELSSLYLIDLSRKYKKKFCTDPLLFRNGEGSPFLEEEISPGIDRGGFSIGQNKNKISISSGSAAGTVTNWKQLFRSLKRGIGFDKKFGKFIYKNDIPFPPYKKLKKSGVQLIDTIKTKKMRGDINQPDCILIVGNGSREILRDSFHLDIPTIATVDSHSSVDYCTFPVWGNSLSVEFLVILIEWFFRSYQKNHSTSL